MKNLEGNKIAAAILMAGVIAMVSGKIADVLYHPAEAKERGFAVEVASSGTGDAAAEEKEEAPLDIPALMAAADIAKGEALFKKCKACHSIDKDGTHRVGPKLYNVINAKIARHADFAYSPALTAIAKNWTYEELFAFLKKPKAYAPGTKMSFAGLKKPEDIANVVIYLRENADNKASLP